MRMFAFVAGLAFAGLTVGSAHASDLYPMQPAPAYNPAAFSFDGFYLGAQGGGVLGGFSAGSVGVVAGVNFNVADPIIVGGEFQADWLFNSNNSTTYDFYALGRAGTVVTQNLLAYVEAGPGWTSNSAGYAFGGGGEYALTDMMSVKGEVLGTGSWGAGPGAAKLQAGLLFHLQ